MAYGFNDDKSKYEIKETVGLWRNYAPFMSSGFADQTVTLNDDWGNYQFIEIICQYSNNISEACYSSVKIPTVVGGFTVTLNVPYFHDNGSLSIPVSGRKVTFASNSDAAKKSLTFGKGYRRSLSAGGNIGKTESNTLCIPIAVIGYKYF